MKSNKGVTLTSLIIYVIGLMVILGIMNSFLRYFNNNVKEITIKEDSNEQYAKLSSYLIKDLNSELLEFIKVSSEEEEGDYIILKFKNNIEHQYVKVQDCIYFLNTGTENRKKILLCKNVEEVTTKLFKYENNNLKINLRIMDEEFSNNLSVTI